MHRKHFIDMTGQQCGRLLVLREDGRSGNRQVMWLCRCNCLNQTLTRARADSLRNGTIQSCGCLRLEQVSAATFKHGQAGSKSRTPEYQAWANMNGRCFNSRSKVFHYYGGRGITICERWRGWGGFLNFLEDLGKRPSNQHSLDRIDVNGNYEPLNCRWATKSEQTKNRRSYKAIATFSFLDFEQEANRRGFILVPKELAKSA